MTGPIPTATPNTPAVTPAVAGLSQSLWWMVFIGDTVTLSMVLGAFKDFTLTPNLTTTGWLALYSMVLVVLTGALVYDGYAKEKTQGKIKNSVRLFDRLYALQMAQSEPFSKPNSETDSSLPPHTPGETL